LWASPNIITVIKIEENKMGEACSKYGRDEKSNILVETSDGKRPLGRPRRRWEGNIRMVLREIRWDVVD
jgi:hypothetical protein